MTLKPALALLLLGAIAVVLGRTFLAESLEPDDRTVAIDRNDVAGSPGAADSDLATIDAVDSGRDTSRTPASNIDPIAGAGEGSGPESGTESGADAEGEQRPLTVVVEWPEGADPAEGLVVYAFRRDILSGDLARTLTSTPDTREKDDRYAFFEELENKDLDATSIRAAILSEAPLTGDAESGWSAQLTVPIGRQRVFIQAFGGGAFTTAPAEVFSPTDSVTIHPVIGARLELVVRPPRDSGADIELARTRVRLAPTQTAAQQMAQGAGAGSPFGTSVDLDDDGRVILTTVPAGMPLKLRLRNDAFAPMDVEIEPLTAGEQRVLELDAQSGAQASGRVVGSDGLGLEGARVTAAIPGKTFGFDDEVVSRTVSDADGEFVLEHLPDGTLIVRADIDHALQSSRVSIDIEESRAVSEIRLSLDEGRAIAGVARYETGEIAAGITIDATFDLAHIAGPSGVGTMRGARGRTTTNEDGAFRVTGLGAGPFTVRASGAPGGAESELWQAREDGVQPGAEALLLELRPPLHVAGIVVDDAGTPLPGVQVDCSRLLAGSMGDVRLGNQSATSDAEGHFRIADLVAGRWVLTVSTDSHVSLEDLILDIEPSVDDTRIVAVRAGSITGTVFDAAGVPIAGAMVEQEHEQPMWMEGISRVVPPARTRTKEDGTFLLIGVRPGTIFLTASAPEMSPARSDAIEIDSGATVEDVELRLMQGGTIEGLCFDNDGRPVGGRVVMVQSTTLSMMRRVSTAGDGTFVVHGLQTGTYQLIAMDPGADLSGDGDGAGMASMFESMDMATAKVVEGETVIVYIGAPPAEPVEVTGRVERAGEPMAGVTLVWMPASEGMYDRMKMATTNGDGDYEVTLDASGDYLISITRFHGGTAQQETIEYHEAIPAGAKEHERDFEVPGGTIAGRIFGADDEPLSGARVTIMEVGGMQTDRMMGGSYAEVPSAADGTFEVAGLRAGTYQIAAGGSTRLGTSTSAPARTIVGDFSLGENERIDDVEIHLAEPGAIEITVRDASGAGVPEATVFLRDGEGRHTELFSMIVTGSNGSVTVSGLAPGRYTAAARTADQASQESTPVDVIEGQTGSVEVLLEPGGTILAVLRAKGDAEIPVASVQVLDAQGRDVTRRIGLSDMRALYTDAVFSVRERRVGPVPPGRYKVLATSADGRKAKRYVTVEASGVQRVTLVLR